MESKGNGSGHGHILEKFTIEFETYWNSREFVPFDPANPSLFRTAIDHARNPRTNGPAVFFDLRPHPFQERILEALDRERSSHDRWRNLVIAATGTGKTVVAAFDFKRFFELKQRQARLLFVAHRQEIFQQAQATFTMFFAIRTLVNCWSASFRLIEWSTCSVPSGCRPIGAYGSRSAKILR